MTKIAEPLTDEEIEQVKKASLFDSSGHALAIQRLLATIEADRQKLAEAEARVSELEKALEPFVSIGNMLTQYPSGAAILYQASGDPSIKITSDHCHAAVAAMFPTPLVKGEG